MMKPLIEILTPQELNQSAWFRTGLFELHQNGEIALKISINFGKRSRSVEVTGSEIRIAFRPHLKTSFYKLKCGNEAFMFAFDGYDLEDSFCEYALQNCRYILKRSYNPKVAQVLEKKYPVKIIPAGLIFPVSSANMFSLFKFKLGFFGGVLYRRLKFRKDIMDQLGKLITGAKREWSMFLNHKPVGFFDKVSKFANDSLFFQTRCFPGKPMGDQGKMQEDRYQLICQLRKSFPLNFKGGFIPDAHSSKLFPDALTDLPTDQATYLKMVQESYICIYTRGLANSLAWKMAEYMSMGKCIVAERIKTHLPFSLEEEAGIIFFDDMNQCVEVCNDLLKRPDEVKLRSEKARLCYEKRVKPISGVRTLISQLCTHE